jgi:arylsulfatase
MDAWELYDLEADRTELDDLAQRQPEIVKDLAARWESWAKRTHTDQWIGPRRNEWGEVPKP